MQPLLAAEANSPVIVGFDAGSPPFFMETKSGEALGIYPRMVKAIFQDSGQPVVLESAPFKRVLAFVDSGAWGAGGILKTPERLAKYDYSDYIFMETLVVYYAKSNPIKFSELADLKGKRVGILLGWSYGEAFDIAMKDLNIKVEPVSEDAINFKKLQAGRLDAVLVLEEVGWYLMASGQYEGLERAKVYFRQNPSFIAFSKKSHQRPLLKKLNQSIARMRKSGQFEAIVQTYLKQVSTTSP